MCDRGRYLGLARRRVVEKFGEIMLAAHGGFQHGANRVLPHATWGIASRAGYQCLGHAVTGTTISAIRSASVTGTPFDWPNQHSVIKLCPRFQTSGA